MADRYQSFEELEENETAGVTYGILARQSTAAFAMVAPHGGGIEEGSSEIANAIADRHLSFYAFEGLKPKNNTDLHITSTRFDEPVCLVLVGRCNVVVTIHGQESEVDGDGIFLGGLDQQLGAMIGTSLKNAGFAVHSHAKLHLQGLEQTNICNRGLSGKGVQIEISRSVRQTMFASLMPMGRTQPTEVFSTFVQAVQGVLLRLVSESSS